MRFPYTISYRAGGRRLRGESHSTRVVYACDIHMSYYPYTRVASIPMWHEGFADAPTPSFATKLLNWWNNRGKSQ